MSLPQQGQRIVGLVRALTSLGLLMVVVTVGLIGWTLNRVRNERVLATAEQDQLNRVADELRQRAADGRMELQMVLDETQPLTNRLQAIPRLIEFISGKPDQVRVGAQLASDQFARLHTQLAEVARCAQEWRANYVPVWQDVSQQRTLGQVRALITQLRGDVETLDGRRRLNGALQHKRWRSAKDDEAARLAQAILNTEGREQSQGVSDFKSELAECARLVELLAGEEQLDSLADLKDNKLKPVLDRLGRTITAFSGEQTNAATLQPQAIEQLRTAICGAGPVGGGLFALRHDALLLRHEREKLQFEIAASFQSLETANAGFELSAQTRTAALTHQMEAGLASGWRRLLYVGGGCSALFLWLAWLISRGIHGQVRAIDHARAEAVQENAERRQAEDALRKNQAQLQTIVENLAEGVAVSDLDGRLLHFNRAALAMHGFGNIEETRRHVTEFAGMFELSELDGTPLPVEQWPLSRVLRGENLRDLDIRVRRPEAGWERVFSYGGSLVHDTAGRPLMAVLTISNITERKRSEAALEKAHKDLLETSRLAGMAEVATGVLHNVGNVLNSVNVSSTCLADSVKKSRVANLSKVVALLREHEADLGAFLTKDAKGKQLPAYLAQLSEHLAGEQAAALNELSQLQKDIEHIKDIVSMQQSFAKVSGVMETLHASELVEDALRMNASSLTRHDVQVIKEFEDVPPLTTEKHKVMQILVNLVRNAQHACDNSGRTEKRLILRVSNGGDRVRIGVSDNGVGILAENLTRIFAHGFTTKKDGHGFGLHSGALAARDMGGSLSVHSEGVGQGATFTLELPLSPTLAKEEKAA